MMKRRLPVILAVALTALTGSSVAWYPAGMQSEMATATW